MSDQRFDLSYRGLLRPGVDLEETRRRLGAIFKLNEAGLERLFTGKPVIVKRDVDAATAAHFERLFAQAGAELSVVPLDTGGPASVLTAAMPPAPTPMAAEGDPPPGLVIDTSMLSLAPPGGVLEEPPPSVSLELDTSYLSLVPGDNWTLEDCEPPPTPIPLPDLSYLTLVPLAETESQGNEARFF
ncbi:MAG: hypothetical protein ACM3ST_07105 [Bdellovibrio bacteriovorus]